MLVARACADHSVGTRHSILRQSLDARFCSLKSIWRLIAASSRMVAEMDALNQALFGGIVARDLVPKPVTVILGQFKLAYTSR